MVSDEPEKSQVLSYQSPSTQPPPSKLEAFLYGLPAMVVWIDLTALITMKGGIAVTILFLGSVWILALAVAIVSLFAFVGRPRPWYVMITLSLNLLLLIMTAGVVCVGAYFHLTFY
jgi:hypothetical protein